MLSPTLQTRKHSHVRSSSSDFPPSTPSSRQLPAVPRQVSTWSPRRLFPRKASAAGRAPSSAVLAPSLLGCSPRPGGSPAYSPLLPVALLTATPRSVLFRTSSLRASSTFPGISVPKEPPPAVSRASLVHPAQPFTLSLAKSIPLLCSGPPAALGTFCLLPHAESGAVLAFS